MLNMTKAADAKTNFNSFTSNAKIKSVHKNKSPNISCKGCDRRACAYFATNNATSLQQQKELISSSFLYPLYISFINHRIAFSCHSDFGCMAKPLYSLRAAPFPSLLYKLEFDYKTACPFATKQTSCITAPVASTHIVDTL